MVKFKVGDKLKCKPGFTNSSADRDNYGGSGYRENVVLTVSRIHHGNRPVYWFEEISGGIYEDALELADVNVEIILW